MIEMLSLTKRNPQLQIYNIIDKKNTVHFLMADFWLQTQLEDVSSDCIVCIVRT